MSKNCIITTVKSKIKGNATSYIEKENEIIIPVSNKFTLSQTRAIAIDKVKKINKEYLSEKFGDVVSLNTSYTDGTGINIHPSKRLVDAYEVKEGNKTLEEVNSGRDLNYFNGDVALYEQEQRDFENEANLMRFSELRQELRVQEGKVNFKNNIINGFDILSENSVIDKEISQQQAKTVFNKKDKTIQDKKDLSIYFANYFLNSVYDKEGLLHLGYTRFSRYGITPPKLLIVKDNGRKNPFFQYNNVVIIGLKQLEKFINSLKTPSFEKFENLINTVAQEEIIHLYADYLLDYQDIDNIYNEMTEKDINQIKKIYGNTSIQKENIVHEYVRMVVQQRVFGRTTEYETFTLSNAIMSFFENLLEELNDFLNRIIGSTNTQKAIEDVINFTKGNFSKELDEKIINRVFDKGQILEANLNVLNNFQEEQEELDKIVKQTNSIKFDKNGQELLFQKQTQSNEGIIVAEKIYNDRKNNFYQLKNIFNSVLEIDNKLKSQNKTASAIGSDKNIDVILKNAGLDSELRKQFIQLLKENPSLKTLKLSEVLNSYLKEFIKESDKQYYKAIDEPISNELENILISYFDKFHIRKQELDNLKEKFGVDSIGVFDVLAKTIYYSKNRNLLTLPEEYGHVFVELLGSIGNKKADNPLFKYMFDNIESWDGYQRVYRDYKNTYLTAEGNIDIYKIKKEAIGQAIGIALVRNYKVQKGDKEFWSKIQEVIDYILNLIKGIDYVSLNTTVDNIAKDILSKNYKKLDRLNKDTSNYNLLSYSETIKNQNKIDKGKALKFMQWFSEKNMIITGSLAYRYQGNVYRPEIDALHDIDNIVPSDIHKLNLNKSHFLNEEQLEKDRIYRKLISEGNYKEAKNYKIQGNLKLDLENIIENVEVLKQFKKEFPDTDFLYSFYNQKANAYYVTINAIWSQNEELKNRFKSYTGSFNDRLSNFNKEELQQIYLFDFFLRPETTEEYKQIKDEEFGLNLAHFNYSFYEKLNMMGRPKDAFDYQMWDYFNENNILAPDFNDRLVYYQLQNSQKSQENEIKEGVEELFEENPDFASKIYEALGFDTLISLSEEASEKVDKIFKKYPELAKLFNNNKELYDSYLKSIFPGASKEFKGKLFFHGTKNPIEGEKFKISDKNLAKGLWFTKQLGYAKRIQNYADKVDNPITYGVVLNIRNPKHFYNSSGALLVQRPSDFEKEYDRENNDAAVFHHPESSDGKFTNKGGYNQIVVFDENQVHIIGDKNDINKAKEFLANQITPQQKQQAILLYSQYLEQNPNGSVEQFKSWVDEFSRNNQKLNSNIQIFSDNKQGDFDSSSLKDDDLALMLFNQALGLNLTSVNQLNWDNIKDNIFFEKENGSLGVKNLAFTSGNLLSTKKATLNDFINQKGLFPEYKVFIGESVIYPNVFETLQTEDNAIKKAVFENLFNLSGAFEQVKNELNNHSPKTFIIETPNGKFTFPKRFAAGFWNIASKVEFLLKENQSSYIQDYLSNKRKKEDIIKDGKEIKPVITQTLTVNDTIVQNAIGLIGNSIIENAIKNNDSVKIQVFSNAEFSEDGIAGWYLPASNTIYLHESMLRPQHLSEGLPLIAHELIHSVTEQSLQFDKNFQREIQSLLDRVKAQSKIKDFYGFKNTSEFLSEAFSSQEFRQLLKDTQFSSTENLSVWQKFVNAILELFGKNVKYTEKSTLVTAEEILNDIINDNKHKIQYVKSTILDKFNTDKSLSDFITQKSQERLNQIQEIFNENPELSKIGTVEQYASYLDTIFPDSKVVEMDNSLYISVLNQLEQEDKIEKDCSGKLKAEKGLQTNFTKNGEWKIIKDLKGYPTHKEGGVDLIIGKDGVSIKNGNVQFIAKHGLVIPKAQNGLVISNNPEYEAMSKVLSQRNKSLNWVERGLNPDKYGKIDNGDGTFSTHRLAYSTGDNGEAYVYPTIIQNDKGELEQLDDDAAWEYAMKTKTAMVVPSVRLAEYYSQNGLIKH